MRTATSPMGSATSKGENLSRAIKRAHNKTIQTTGWVESKTTGLAKDSVPIAKIEDKFKNDVRKDLSNTVTGTCEIRDNNTGFMDRRKDKNCNNTSLIKFIPAPLHSQKFSPKRKCENENLEM